MSKRNPIERSQYINNQYKEYLRSSFEFKTPKLQKLFEQQLEVEDLFKGPYVDLNLPFQRGMSLDEMIADGAVCKSFHRLGDMNFERPLYSHQEESIRHNKPQPPRFCDVIVEGEKVTLEVKQDKNKIETIPWDDLVYQVKAAKEMAISK